LIAARLSPGRRHLPNPSTDGQVRTELGDLYQTTDADTTRIDRAD